MANSSTELGIGLLGSCCRIDITQESMFARMPSRLPAVEALVLKEQMKEQAVLTTPPILGTPSP
jgi:hypothetical protein